METQVQKFECYAIVELMGHQQMAGLVTEQTFGPATFFRVSVPETSTSPAFDRLVNPSAIYAINPVAEAVARARAEQIKYQPISAWDVRQMLKANEEPVQRRIESGDDEDSDLPY